MYQRLVLASYVVWLVVKQLLLGCILPCDVSAFFLYWHPWLVTLLWVYCCSPQVINKYVSSTQRDNSSQEMTIVFILQWTSSPFHTTQLSKGYFAMWNCSMKVSERESWPQAWLNLSLIHWILGSHLYDLVSFTSPPPTLGKLQRGPFSEPMTWT